MIKKHNMLKAVTLLLFAILYNTGYAQNVGINSTGAPPDASALLDLVSSSKGFLAPRMSFFSRGNISNPVTGLLIYQLDNTPGFYYYTGSAWLLIGTSSSGWNITGNAGTSASTNFLGTTDAVDLVFKTAGSERARIVGTAGSTLGYTGIGTNSPISPLHIYASSGDVLFLQVPNATNNTANIAFKTSVQAGPATSSISATDDNNYSNNLIFSTKVPGAATNALTEKMRLSSSGRLGIGITPPTQMLDVGGNVQFSGALMPNSTAGTAGYVLTSAGAGLPPTWTSVATATSTSWNRIGDAGTSPGTTASPGANYLGTSDAVDLAFRTANTERMRIASGGAITLNGLASGSSSDYIMSVVNATNTLKKINPSATSSPVWSTNGNSGVSGNFLGTTDAFALSLKAGGVEKISLSGASNGGVTVNGQSAIKDVLYVKSDVNSYASIEVQNNNTGNAASSDVIVSNDGTVASVLNAKEYYADLGINSTSYNNNTTSNILNGINRTYLYSSSPADFYIGNGYSAKDIVFFTNYGNTNTNNTADGYEVMRIYGGTGNGGSAAQTQVVTIGNVAPYLLNKLTVGGGVAATAYVTSSDRRLKTNIRGLNYGLKDVLRLRPVSYNWIDQNQSQDTQLGLIAQEAREVIPEIVLGNEAKEKLSVNYTELIPVLINAIKEQQKQIDDLKKQVESLKK